MPARQLQVLRVVDVLYVHQEQVGHVHQLPEFVEPGAFLCEGAARRVYAGVDVLLLRLGQKLRQKVNLRERLPAADRDTAVLSPVALAVQCLLYEAVRRPLLALRHVPGVRVVAELAAQGAAREEDEEADTRPVHRPEAFYRMYVAFQNDLLTREHYSRGACSCKAWAD